MVQALGGLARATGEGRWLDEACEWFETRQDYSFDEFLADTVGGRFRQRPAVSHAAEHRAGVFARGPARRPAPLDNYPAVNKDATLPNPQ